MRIILVALALPADEEESIVADHNSAMLTGAMCASDAMLDWRSSFRSNKARLLPGLNPSEDDAFQIADELGLLHDVVRMPGVYPGSAYPDTDNRTRSAALFVAARTSDRV